MFLEMLFNFVHNKLKQLARKSKKEDTGLRGDYQGNLYVDKKVFYKRKCVQENINSAKKWYYKNYT